MGSRSGRPARSQAVASIALSAARRRVPSAVGLLQLAVSALDRQLCGDEIRSTYVADGSAVPVRDHRMPPFDSDFVAIVGQHARMTAVAITDFLGVLGECQIPR